MPKLRNLHKILDPEIRRKNARALRYELRGLLWDLARPTSRDPLFVVGCSRSGTTVTYETVAAARVLLSFGHEIPQFWDGLWGPRHNGWQSEAATADEAKSEHRKAAFRFFFQRLGRGRVMDKTCINVMRLPYLYRLFPKATFLFIHRDGRDNVSSMMDGWRHDGHFSLGRTLGRTPDTVAINGGEFREWSFFLPPGWRDYNHAALEEVCAYQWITANLMALQAKQVIPDEQWIQLRYEDIFHRPVEMFRDTFRRLELPFDDAMRQRCESLASRPTSIVKGAPKRQKWKQHNPDAIERILDQIRPTMAALGYDADD